MNTALITLQKYDIPVHSYIAAVQSLTDIVLTPEQYRDRINELSSNECKADDRHVRIHYQYLVQETVRRSMNTDVIDMNDIFEISEKRATEFCATHSWSFADYDSNVSLSTSSSTSSKPKKGSKKILAKEVWEKNKDVEMTRKEWIALLVEEVKLTPAGASTYYSNLKNNKF